MIKQLPKIQVAEPAEVIPVYTNHCLVKYHTNERK